MTDTKQTANEARRFTMDMLWVAASQLLIQALGVITLPALTKTYSSELYGVWTQTSVTVGLLVPIITLHLSTAAVRFLSAEDDVNVRRRQFGAMLWPILVLGLIVLSVSLSFGEKLSLFIFSSNQYQKFIPLAFTWVCTGALFNFGIAYLRARGKIRRLALINISFSITKMLLIVILATQGFGLEWIMGSIIVVEGLLVLLVFGLIISEIGIPWPNTTGIKRFLAFSIPQIPSGILLWVISASDRYFITHLLDLSQAGIYSASYSLGSLISIFFSPISFVLLPSLSRFWENRQITRVKNYLEYSNKLFLALAIPGAAGLFVLSQPLLKLLTRPEYAVGGELVLLIALGVLLLGLYQINLYIMYLLEQTKWLPLMILAAAGVNAGINIVLIPQVGIIGAAVSTIVAYLVLAAIVTIWARKAISYKLDVLFIGKVILATGVMSLCLWFIPVEGVVSIGLAVVAGLVVYGASLVLLKTFSGRDTLVIKEIVRR
ncbi:MAG: polysaccharide biosynthesis C-terminal domain-containing protein [Dehalococcoidales bacterium]|jgi:O-antigen/teichoic acid export membrane protein